MNLPSLFSDPFETDSFRQLAKMQREMDRFFSNLPNETASLSYEVEEAPDHFVLSMDMPGIKKEDIKIELHGGRLQVSGERKSNTEEKNGDSYRTERTYGKFERSFSLPEEIKAEQIETHYQDGVLRIAVPKITRTKAQQIKIGESKPGFFDRIFKKEKAIEVKGTDKVA